MLLTPFVSSFSSPFFSSFSPPSSLLLILPPPRPLLLVHACSSCMLIIDSCSIDFVSDVTLVPAHHGTLSAHLHKLMPKQVLPLRPIVLLFIPLVFFTTSVASSAVFGPDASIGTVSHCHHGRHRQQPAHWQLQRFRPQVSTHVLANHLGQAWLYCACG